MAIIRPASGFPGRRCQPGLCPLCFPPLACSPRSLPLLGLTTLPGLYEQILLRRPSFLLLPFPLWEPAQHELTMVCNLPPLQSSIVHEVASTQGLASGAKFGLKRQGTEAKIRNATGVCVNCSAPALF